MKTSNLHVKIDHLPFSLQEEVSIFIDQLLAKLPEKKEKKQPVFGSGKGTITMSEDFDEPLEDFKDYI
jgi:hypothetical protein